ncbi:hypothetical protein [Clostridium sp. HBUAS56010]|uniref:hypothetical protein n=1 Tax=Clostridium sp. HBUAS56010 TaxID=2571127 RepID=UPI001177D64A|nr:hypothetical protein [Clostridium sp. HBUAS56010]
MEDYKIPMSHKWELPVKSIQEKAEEINEVLKKMMGKSLMLEWGIMQGMHITGSTSPYDFFQNIFAYKTEPFSHLITQDVLLLAGQNDHYVPIKQFANQISALTKVHSLTARTFTSEESADNHCQTGNLGLATEVMPRNRCFVIKKLHPVRDAAYFLNILYYRLFSLFEN